MPGKKRREKATGTLRQLSSGRWQARFRGPDGVLRPAPQTFDTKLDADAWLKRQSSDVDRGMWQPPDEAAGGPVPTLQSYAEGWLATRPLKPQARHKYERLLRLHILPKLGDTAIDRITPQTVRNWHASTAPDHPSARAHAYSLLRTIMNTAHSDDLLPKGNPCRIWGAGQNPPSKHEVKDLPLPVLEQLVAEMPRQYAALVLLAAWCGLRLGELLALQRKDLDLEEGLVRVTKNLTHLPGAVCIVDEPKSAAGKREVTIPPHLTPLLQQHLDEHVGKSPNALLWTTTDPEAACEHLSPHAFRAGPWEQARRAIGRPTLRVHDLRHTGATLAAASGATIKELMVRMGQSSPKVAMIYQVRAQARERLLAEALSEAAATGGNVVPLRKAGS